MGSGGDEAGVGSGLMDSQASKARPWASGTGQFGIMGRHSWHIPVFSLPPPDSARKFLIFNEMQRGLRSKFLILLEFFADSSWQRGYGRFLELSASAPFKLGSACTGRERHYGTIVLQWIVILCKRRGWVALSLYVAGTCVTRPLIAVRLR